MAAAQAVPNGGLLEEWMKTVVNKNGGTFSSRKEAMEQMKEDLRTTWEELTQWLVGRWESYEISRLCESAGDILKGEESNWHRGEYLRNVCKGIVEIKYFMRGVKTIRLKQGDTKDEDPVITPLTNEEAYRRCIVGTVALSEIYGDHCHLKDVIDHISRNVENNLKKKHSQAAKNLDKCKNIDQIALIFGKALLQEEIKRRAQAERAGRKNENWRIWVPWNYWKDVCKVPRRDPTKLQQQREENAQHMTEFLKVGDNSSSSSSAGTPSISDVLVNDDYSLDQNTLQKVFRGAMQLDGSFQVGGALQKIRKATEQVQADGCMKQEGKTLCQRLECAKKRWELNNKAQQQNFWDNYVKPQLEKLLPTSNDSAALTDYCKDASNLDSANKEACKHMTKFLHQMYKNSNGSTKEYSDQIIKCVLLKEYANKLKEKAKEGGYCSIDDGLQKAFEKSKDFMKNGTSQCGDPNDNKCFECKWTDTTNDGLDNCRIDSSQSEKVQDKVKTLFSSHNQTQDPKIQETLAQFNTNNSLCEYVNCAAKRWKENNSTSGHGSGQEEFWEENGPMKKLWDELANKMKDSNGKDASGSGQCGSFGTEAEKAACKYLHAGLTHLYTTTASSSVLDNPSFRQTMGCFLLHSYAKYMKDKAICNIDKGIQEAFKNNNATCSSGKEPCVPCQWNDTSMENCTVQTSTNDTGTARDKVEGIFQEDKDKNISTMLTAINKMETLCNRLQCIASHLNSTNGQKPSITSADTFWTTSGEVERLWNDLSNAMTNNGNDAGDCGTVDSDRPATNPERKACQYLTAGFEKLKEIAASNGNGTKILDKDPSLKQAMGCLLLKEYAKRMKGKSKCVIESGIKEAFNSWNRSITNGTCNGTEPCVPCQWNDTNIDQCKIGIIDAAGDITQTAVKDKLTHVQSKIDNTSTETLPNINSMSTLCDYIRCAAPKWFKNKNGTNGNSKHSWCDFWEEVGVKPELVKMFTAIRTNGNNKSKQTNVVCDQFGDDNPDSVERRACNHITAGLDYIKKIPNGAASKQSNGQDNQLLQRAVGCIALNMYADKIRDESDKVCPIGEEKINKMFEEWNNNNNSSSSTPCNGVSGTNSCFKCTREKDFNSCDLLVNKDLIATASSGGSSPCNNNDNDKDKVPKQMNNLLNEDKSTINTKMKQTLDKITDMKSSFCTQVQCAIKKKLKSKNGQTPSSGTTQPWKNIEEDATKELKELLEYMSQSKNQEKVNQYCKDNEDKWNKIGHKEGRTNKAACLLFASGLKHIYTHDNGRVNGRVDGRVNGPSFGQTMGCLFLKEYAKQLQTMANEKKKGYSWVHPLCDIDKGIEHAFNKSSDIMNGTPPCNNGNNSCFVCTWHNNDYDKCKIGNDQIQDQVKPLLGTKSDSMEKTLENTVCPILLTDLLTPFLPLAPVSIGLSAMAYYLWKYFGPLGKGGQRFRRSPAEIPGPSVQEQVLDHVEEAGSHEYRLVKKRKPRSAATRTERSGHANRRAIIEIHFEVLDECQKGDTQLNQKDFLELLVQEFMGSEFMKEEQVPKEEVLMEGVPIERVPILGSGFMV
ncbi:SICAvar, type I [Plasmodium knowlesi strain H]|uniref:SICAvar, type I n=3 Tax=Plasmodium knowlesi TaxID=5850 RepID=A0A5K1VFP5_PLAKH|nr:SICAvar, type I [Plasmodium knowlesi strain H]OTN64248.1 SICAvar type I [Plasmodium knowlesi]CAA9990669.1 SICAvar, type I [Plasmodium knowlesi strain H]SBO25953.1 SICAvar, type I [Plasmodium knowlesi strain H]SBO28689.1 SICAvar, type I [Plasmodium knowlesi strain H]VVS80143.1 SICAvar, type I [Plasmodium knowlesi strain H]|eukprot:XP_002261960.1 SICA antigen [Plasmodium knowlesi strain H]